MTVEDSPAADPSPPRPAFAGGVYAAHGRNARRDRQRDDGRRLPRGRTRGLVRQPAPAGSAAGGDHPRQLRHRRRLRPVERHRRPRPGRHDARARPRTTSSSAPTAAARPALRPTRPTPAGSAPSRATCPTPSSWCASTRRRRRRRSCRSPATSGSRSRGRAARRRSTPPTSRDNPSRLVQTIEENFGVFIDHTVQVSLCAFKSPRRRRGRRERALRLPDA